ncbi:MAG: aminotransferase class III-fold pyridoxal phosphate-dependent enzyme [bacterium]|nr:aminotransferase class III-fold pyridoxal phosphate-dependent enzyme [bacterium]
METFTYEKSQALFERAGKVVPCGIYGHFSPAPLVPVEAYPFYAERAQGARFWDVDGNEFVDYMCAYGPMILGYNHPVVDEAYQAQMKLGNAMSCPSPKMVELAEFLVDLVPVADWAYFAKNGGDITNYAIMVARAATGRKKIVGIAGGYHGVSPWMQGTGHHGAIEEDAANVIRIPWNDIPALERVLDEHAGDVAGFIATPYHHPNFQDNALPADGYWQKVQAMLNKDGAVLIVDDVRCGFRLDMRGSHEHFGFTPDLVCFCKALANGYPISALVGTDALRSDAAKVFYTGSYWFSAGPMAAALACLNELKRIDAPRVMLDAGTKLLDGMVRIADSHGYTMKVTGAPALPYVRLTDDETLMLHQDWCAECTKRGALFTSHHNWFLSAAHTDEDIQHTWDIVDDAFKAVKANQSA